MRRPFLTQLRHGAWQCFAEDAGEGVAGKLPHMCRLVALTKFRMLLVQAAAWSVPDKRRSICLLMDLQAIRIGEGLDVRIPIVLVIGDVMSELRVQCFLVTFNLAVGLRVVGCCC